LLVLLDTSILIFLVERPSSFMDDLAAQLGKAELCVPDSVIRELRSLARSRGARARKAKEALSFVGKLRTVKSQGEADDALVRLAQEEGGAVATLDRELVSSLRRKGIPVATVKGDRLRFLGASL
jgi:rRNA-processing protein FCF1